MADISKCSGEGCNQKEKCYRFTAKPNEYYQSWMSSPAPDPLPKKWKCPEFWDNEHNRATL